MIQADPNILALINAVPKITTPFLRRQKQERREELRYLLRRIERLSSEGLSLYQPLPLSQQAHVSTAKWRILDGSNRSAKTMTGAAELARAVCGCDPYDKFVKRNGNVLMVGLKEEHIALMWRKLTVEGAFKKIRDEHTGLWRSVRADPNDPMHIDPYDAAYREQWKDAPPLIPPRMITSVAYEAKNKGIPRMATFKTGWRLNTRSSNGQPDQGDHYNLVWFDEEMENIQFYYEAVRGLVGLDEPPKHTPRGIWTATSQVANAELQELRERAEQGSEDVHLFRFLIEHNPYVPDAEKQAFLESLPEDERQCRYYGIPAMFGRRIYPTYDPNGIHGCEPRELPLSWCRYVVVDPGRQHCATLFCAIDPDQEHAWIYDGFDLRNADATIWASEVANRQQDYCFEAIIIDQQMGKQHPPGAGQNVAEQYWAALEAAGVKVRTQGILAGFFPGTNDVRAREEALLGWMTIRGTGPFSGSCKLQVMRGALPDALHKQVKGAHMRLADSSKREKNNDEDLLVCLEYMAAHDPLYYEPESVVAKPEIGMWDLYKQIKKPKRQLAYY